MIQTHEDFIDADIRAEGITIPFRDVYAILEKDGDMILTTILITTNNKDMELLGYYAKDLEGNLFKYEWGASDEFYIINSDGCLIMADPNEYEVLEIGYTISK